MTQPPTRPGGERFWNALHRLVNRAAWRWARPDGENWGIALRIDHSRPLWRLNDWIADRYVPALVRRQVQRMTPHPPQDNPTEEAR